jgi:hypothetical protein
MAKTVKVAILRGRNDASALLLTPALEQACQEMLVTNLQRQAVLEYWTDLSDGYFQFDVTVMPWVDVAFSSADADENGKIKRWTQFNKITAATRMLPGRSDLSAYDGFIVLTGPGAAFANPSASQPGQPAQLDFDGGSMLRGQHGAYAVLPIAASSHSFMCHEFGHVLGLFDSEGVLSWKGPIFDTGYGDPFDIMSALSFADSQPVFAGGAISGWPNPSARQKMGPAPSRAEMHYFFPDATPSQYVKSLVVADDNTPPIRLNAAYGGANSTRLVVVNTPEPAQYSRGRCYIEYRDSQWWDAGLDTAGHTLDRQSVVVHVVETLKLDPGAGDTGIRAFYRGRITVPVEIDSDLEVRGTPYTVRVVDANVDQRYVMVKITRSNQTGFDIETTGRHITVPSPEQHEIRHTPCGDELHWGRWETISTYAFHPTTWGLGGYGSSGTAVSTPPTISWTVGDVAVPAGSTNGTLLNCSAPQGTFNVRFSVDPALGTLTLTSEQAGQTYQMLVRATAAHANNSVTLVQTATFDSKGSYVGYPPADVRKLMRCLDGVLGKIHINPADFVLPTGREPRPNWREWLQLAVHGARRLGPEYASHAQSLARIIELGADLVIPSDVTHESLEFGGRQPNG